MKKTVKKPESSGDELKQQLVGIKAFLIYVWDRFTQDRGWRMAAGLSYTSLLAIVPLSAIAFSMLAAFPVFEGVKERFQSILFQNLLPQSADAMQEYFNTFISNTSGLSALGIVALALTAVLLLGTIEADMNAIFRVKKARALVPRLLVFWAMLTLGPLLLGASFSLSTYFFAATKWMGVDVFVGPIGLLSQFAPTAIIILLLGLFYLTIPNRSVSVRAACIGGLSAGLLFAGLRQVFGWYVATFPTYQNIYGALSVVPIFLVWMYLSWTVVLLGGVLTASLTEWQRAGGKPLSKALGAGPKLVTGLRILATLMKASVNGKKVARRSLLKDLGCAEEAADHVMALLREGGFVQRTDRGGWVLSRDLNQCTLFDLYDVLELGLREDDLSQINEGTHEEWSEGLSEKLDELRGAEKSAIDVSIGQFLGNQGTSNS